MAKNEIVRAQMAQAIEHKDEIGSYLDEIPLEVTGTEAMSGEDVRLPTWALNAKSGKDARTGRAVAPDVFWNTMTEQSKEKLRLVVLTNHKSREYKVDVNGEQQVVCRSWDGVVGEMMGGDTRPCAGCVFYEWQEVDGKRKRHCTDVYNVLTVDRETNEVAVLKVKKTAIANFRNYYQKHFYKKRRTDKGFVDYPFFMGETVVESEEKKSDKFTWYVPTFTFGGLLPKDEIVRCAELVRSFLEDRAQRERVRSTIEHDDADVIDVKPADAPRGRVPQEGDDDDLPF